MYCVSCETWILLCMSQTTSYVVFINKWHTGESVGGYIYSYETTVDIIFTCRIYRISPSWHLCVSLDRYEREATDVLWIYYLRNLWCVYYECEYLFLWEDDRRWVYQQYILQMVFEYIFLSYDKEKIIYSSYYGKRRIRACNAAHWYHHQ